MLFTMQSFTSLVKSNAVCSVFVALIVTSISLLVLWLLGFEDVQPKEPPVVRSQIPFIGHMLGLLKHHNNYFTKLKYT